LATGSLSAGVGIGSAATGAILDATSFFGIRSPRKASPPSPRASGARRLSCPARAPETPPTEQRCGEQTLANVEELHEGLLGRVGGAEKVTPTAGRARPLRRDERRSGEEADQHEDEPRDAEPGADPRQHMTVVMIAPTPARSTWTRPRRPRMVIRGERPVALLLGRLRARRELLAAFVRLGLRVVSSGGFLQASSCSRTPRARRSAGAASCALSAAVRKVVMRIVFAWKNAHRFDASML